jgi:hypothetical protein
MEKYYKNHFLNNFEMHSKGLDTIKNELIHSIENIVDDVKNSSAYITNLLTFFVSMTGIISNCSHQLLSSDKALNFVGLGYIDEGMFRHKYNRESRGLTRDPHVLKYKVAEKEIRRTDRADRLNWRIKEDFENVILKEIKAEEVIKKEKDESLRQQTLHNVSKEGWVDVSIKYKITENDMLVTRMMVNNPIFDPLFRSKNPMFNETSKKVDKFLSYLHDYNDWTLTHDLSHEEIKLDYLDINGVGKLQIEMRNELMKEYNSEGKKNENNIVLKSTGTQTDHSLVIGDVKRSASEIHTKRVIIDNGVDDILEVYSDEDSYMEVLSTSSSDNIDTDLFGEKI